MDLPKLIRVTRYASRVSLEIDGVEFPWPVGVRGPSVEVSGSSCPAVFVELLAERVEVIDSLDLEDERSFAGADAVQVRGPEHLARPVAEAIGGVHIEAP